jgi:hypothetical protein
MMSKVSVHLSDSLHKQLRECASAEGTSIDQLINSAVAEKLAALLGHAYLEERAKRASRKKFEAALNAVPDVEPPAFDRLPRPMHKRNAPQNGRRKKPKMKSGDVR